jgi:serine/threonine protein kinase
MDLHNLSGSLLGQYQVLEQLGEGGMARVYKAQHPRLKRLVALKIILPDAAARPGFRERFDREAQVVAQLHHSNIVEVYDYGEANGIPYLVMQYVGGGTLSSKLRNGQPLPVAQAVRYTALMAQALHHAHQRGIIHRDIKPSNMLLDEQDPNHLLLSDFGIAKLLSGPAESVPPQGAIPQPLTTTGSIIGTPEFMAPEQAKGETIDARTDIYSLGLVLYLLLTGRLPFRSDTPWGVLYQQINYPPPALSQINPAVPTAVIQALGVAIAKDPQQRFQTAEAFAHDLESAMLSASQIDYAPTILAQPGPTVLAPDNPLRATNSVLPAPPTPIITQPGPGLAPASAITAADTPTTISRQQMPPAPGAVGAVQISAPPGAPTFNTLPTPLPGQSPIFTPKPPEKPRHKLLPWLASGISLLLVAALILALMPGHPLLTLLGIGVNTSPTATTGAQPTVSGAITDDFTVNTHGWQTGHINNDPALNWTLGHGVYDIVIPAGQPYVLSYPIIPTHLGTPPASFTLEVKVKQISGQTNLGYGLLIREAPVQGGVRGYAFTINSDGGYQFVKYPSSNTSASFTDGKPAVLAGLNQINDLKLVAKGGSYTFSVNDQPLALGGPGGAVTDSDYASGAVGLLVTGDNAEYQFTYFSLTPTT